MPSYFAFVRRTARRRYSATLPDLGGLTVFARGPRHLADAAVSAARQAGLGRGNVPPVPTALRDLPRMAGDDDGYWLLIDLAEALPAPDPPASPVPAEARLPAEA